jgi:hypothetical protein
MDEKDQPPRIDVQHGDSIKRQLANDTVIQKPLVIDLKLENSYRKRLYEASLDVRQSVFVTISGLAPGPDKNVSIRCFLNLPSANVKTQADDPHYAGSFSFFIDVSEKNREFSQRIELDQVILKLSERGLWNGTNSFKLTLLAAPLNEQNINIDARIPITAISLEIAESSK